MFTYFILFKVKLGQPEERRGPLRFEPGYDRTPYPLHTPQYQRS